MIKNFKLFESSKEKEYDEDFINKINFYVSQESKMLFFNHNFKSNRINNIDINDGSMQSITLKKVFDEKLVDVTLNDNFILDYFILKGEGSMSVVKYIIDAYNIDPNIILFQKIILLNISNEDTSIFDFIFNLPGFDPSFSNDRLLKTIINHNTRLDDIKTLVKDERVNVNSIPTPEITEMIEDGMDDILEIILPYKTISSDINSDDTKVIIDANDFLSVLAKADIDTFKIVVDNTLFDLTYRNNRLLEKCILHGDILTIKYLVKKTGITTNLDPNLLNALSQSGILPSYKGRKIKR